MGGKSQPDYQQAAIAQGEANREVARDQTFANRPDQFTPWGSTTWNPYQTVDPATGEATTAWQQTSSLTPELQEILNKEIAIQGARSDIAGALTGRAGAEFGTPMDWSGLSPMGEVPVSQFTMPEGDVGDPYETRQRAENAMYESAMSRIQPSQQQARQQMEIRLRNQGLSPEDEAWQTQMGNLGMSQADERQQALWRSVGEGRAESGQMFDQLMDRNQTNFQQAFDANQANFGQAMRGSAYANQIRQQQIAEQMQKRGFSLNEINALLSGQQVGMPQMPSFMGASQAQAAPVYQAAADQGSVNAAMSPWSALIGAGGTAAGAWLGG